MATLARTLPGISRSVSNFWNIFRDNKKALFGLAVMVFFVLMATVGPLIVPLDLTSNVANRFQTPSLKHPLGTDFAGRDTLAQLVHGSRDVLTTAFLAACFTVGIGAIIGALAGLRGGWADTLLMRLTDVMLTVPSFPVLMILAVSFKVQDPVSIGLLLSVWAWAGLARAVRSEVLSLKQREFIEAARLLRLSTPHIIFGELLPNLMGYITLNFIRTMRGALTASIGLMFLGLIPYSPTNWGVMFNLAIYQTGSIYIHRAIFYVLAPMGAIILFQYGALCFASGLEAVFDPRLRAHE